MAMKPRVLYFAVFVFFSLAGGRFTATFLEHELHFSENWMVSGAMAVQLLSSSLCKPLLAGLADSLEASRGNKNNGRLRVMSLGLLCSTIATLLHSLGSLWMNMSRAQQNDIMNSDLAVPHAEIDTSQPNVPMVVMAYHLCLRAIFAVGTSACMPVLDGLTLAQLELEGRDKQEYGKERVYGAVSWGIAHILFGPVIDLFGFKSLYATIILSFVGCIITFHLYAKSISTIPEYNGVIEKNENDDLVDLFVDEFSPLMKQPQKVSKYKSTTRIEDDDQFDINEVHGTDNEKSKERLSFANVVHLFFQESPILNMSYIISVFALFVGMSVVESLIFLYFEFLGGSNTMCGLTVSVTVLFELPLFHFAPEVLKILGPIRLLLWACFAYVVRVIGYSFIPQSHPYLVLFLEPLHGITIAFATTSSVAFADEYAPAGYEASGQGFLSMIRSLGMFVGLCIGGLLEGRTLYRVLAVIVSFGSLTLGIGNYLATKPQKEASTTTIQHPPKQGVNQMAEMT